MKRRTLLQSIAALFAANTASGSFGTKRVESVQRAWTVTECERYFHWDSTGIPHIGHEHEHDSRLICKRLDWETVRQLSDGEHVYEVTATYEPKE